jgi:hypothetical protein
MDTERPAPPAPSGTSIAIGAHYHLAGRGLALFRRVHGPA